LQAHVAPRLFMDVTSLIQAAPSDATILLGVDPLILAGLAAEVKHASPRFLTHLDAGTTHVVANWRGAWRANW